jgi:hypothetical protein
MLGRELQLPSDASINASPNPQRLSREDIELHQRVVAGARAIANDRIVAAQDRNRTRVDATRSNVTFKPGDKVILAVDRGQEGTARKVGRRGDGPFVIDRKISDLNYTLKEVPHTVFPVERLTAYVEREYAPGEQLEDDDEFDVDYVYMKKIVNGRLLYRIHFVGYSHSHDRYEPIENFGPETTVVKEFEDRCTRDGVTGMAGSETYKSARRRHGTGRHANSG